MMKRFFCFVFVLFILLIFVPLQSCSQMSNNKILRLLNDRYGKDFSILNSKFSPETGKIHVKAICTDYPELPFLAEYNEQNNLFQSYFEEVLWTDEAKKLMNTHLKAHYQKFASNTKVRVNKKVDLREIPSLQTIMASNPESVNFTIQLYLFKDLTETNADSLLLGIESITNTLISKEIDQLSFTISFYDEHYFANKKLDDYNFGFTSVAPENFEQIEESKFRQKIMFRVFSTSPPVRAKMLYKIRTEDAYHLMFHIIK